MRLHSPSCCSSVLLQHSYAAEPEGRLVVLVSFDQMRGDYPDRWASLYGEDGFKKMQKEGLWLPQAYFAVLVYRHGGGPCDDRHRRLAQRPTALSATIGPTLKPSTASTASTANALTIGCRKRRSGRSLEVG